MLQAIYSGPDGELNGRSTAIREDPLSNDHYLCQFDDLHLKQSHGWHMINKNYLIVLEDESAKENNRASNSHSLA